MVFSFIWTDRAWNNLCVCFCWGLYYSLPKSVPWSIFGKFYPTNDFTTHPVWVQISYALMPTSINYQQPFLLHLFASMIYDIVLLYWKLPLLMHQKSASAALCLINKINTITALSFPYFHLFLSLAHPIISYVCWHVLCVCSTGKWVAKLRTRK